MLSSKTNYFIFILFFVFISARGQQDGVIKYQGFFPDDTKSTVLISLKQIKSKLTGILKYQNKFQTSNLEGYINKEKVFRLFELDADGNRTGVSMKGTIDGGRMKASYSDRGNVFEFGFIEVSLNNSDSTLQEVKRTNDAFAELELEFKTLGAQNLVMNYDNQARSMTLSSSPFLDFSITKVGSYSAPFTIRERMKYVQKHAFGKKVKFDEGCTGLIVHDYYYSYEGGLLNVYMFVYDEYGDYVQSFVLYEAIGQASPNIVTKFSSSQIFSIVDYSQGVDNPLKFKLDKNGEFNFLDRE